LQKQKKRNALKINQSKKSKKMNTIITKHSVELAKQVAADGLLTAEAWHKSTLAQKPAQNEVFVNKFADNSQYVPISIIEDKLDEFFVGLWQVSDFKYQIVANELIGSLQLKVFHPIAQIWIERTGAAAVMIRQKKDAEITDVNAKIKNALVMDVPHLKAECITNAARSLGKIFGRDLNRKADMQGNYDTFYTNEVEYQNTAIDLQEKLKNCLNVDDLGILWDSLEPSEKQNNRIVKLFSARKAEIKIGI